MEPGRRSLEPPLPPKPSGLVPTVDPADPPEPFTAIELRLPPDVVSTLLGLAEVVAELAETYPDKAADVRRSMHRTIQESILWEIT